MPSTSCRRQCRGLGRPSKHPSLIMSKNRISAAGFIQTPVRPSRPSKSSAPSTRRLRSRQDQPVPYGMTEGFHNVQRQRRPSIIHLMEKSQERIQARALQQRGNLMRQQGIGKRKQRIDRISRWMLMPPGPHEIAPVEHHEPIEIVARGCALAAVQFPPPSCSLLSAPASAQSRIASRQNRPARHDAPLPLPAQPAHFQVWLPPVRWREPKRGAIPVGVELMQPQLDVLAPGRRQRSPIIALTRKQTHRDSFVEHLRHGLRGYLDVAENQHVL